MSSVKAESSNDAQSATTIAVHSLQNKDAIQIKDTGFRRGLGVFTKVPLSKDHRVIVEPAAIRFPFMRHSRGRLPHPIISHWENMSPEERRVLAVQFFKLRSIRPSRNKKPGWLSWRDKRLLRRFNDDYAFHNLPKTHSHIYELTSHINNACVRCANAELIIDSEYGTGTVRLVKDVPADSELFINYHRNRDHFRCPVHQPSRVRERFHRIGRLVRRRKPPPLPYTKGSDPEDEEHSQARISLRRLMRLMGLGRD